MTDMQITRIEDKIDKEAAGSITLYSGGIAVSQMRDLMELAKMMAIAGEAIPPHLRGKPGTCLAVCIQAHEWRMSPFPVANKTYVVNDRLQYESQLVHALIEARAPIKERLHVDYEGEGLERRCIVWTTLKGESAPRVFKSETLRKLMPPMGEKGRKGSPLWDKKPDVQLFYNASRDWCRIYCPDILLGIYTPDEVDETPIPVDDGPSSPNLMQRLPGKIEGVGRAVENVTDGLNGEDAFSTSIRRNKTDPLRKYLPKRPPLRSKGKWTEYRDLASAALEQLGPDAPQALVQALTEEYQAAVGIVGAPKGTADDGPQQAQDQENPEPAPDDPDEPDSSPEPPEPRQKAPREPLPHPTRVPDIPEYLRQELSAMTDPAAIDARWTEEWAPLFARMRAMKREVATFQTIVANRIAQLS
jgi:hypothetical protein